MNPRSIPSVNTKPMQLFLRLMEVTLKGLVWKICLSYLSDVLDLAPDYLVV